MAAAEAIPYVATNRIATYLEPGIFPYAGWGNSLLQLSPSLYYTPFEVIRRRFFRS
jgi:hypothetical protein